MYGRTLNGRSRTETGIEGNGMGMTFASIPRIKCQEQEMARGSWVQSQDPVAGTPNRMGEVEGQREL